MADDQISISAAEAIKEMRDLTKEAAGFLKLLRPMESALEEVANGMALTATNSRKMVTAQQATNNAIRDMTAALRNNTKERDKASESVVNLSRSVEKMVDMLVKDRSAVETLSASQDKLVASTLRLTQEVRSLGTAQTSAGKASASTSASMRAEADSVASLEEAYAKYRRELSKIASSNAGMGDPEAARRLREELTQVQEAFAKTHPDVKEYEAALSRATAITQKSLSPMEALQVQLTEMRSALAAGGPDADKFAGAIGVLEGKLREAQEAFAKTHPDVKEYEAALSKAAAITQKSLSPMEALQAQLTEMRSALAAGGPEADKFRAAIRALEQAEARLADEMANTLPSVRAQKSALEGIRNELRKAETAQERFNRELKNLELSGLAKDSKEYTQYLSLIERQLHEATAAQQRFNGAAAFGAPQIGKFGRSLNLTAQGAAIFREGMQGAGMGIGFMSAQTIVASAAAYGLGKALKSSISQGMEFEYVFTQVAVLMSEAADVMGDFSLTTTSAARAVSDEMLRLAKNTQYGVTEVANAASILARSGMDAAGIYNNLESVLDLAAVGMLEMSEAADIATGLMASFSLEGQRFTDAVDVLAYAANKSKASVEDLGKSLEYIGPIGAQVGMEFEGVIAALSELSEVNIRGSKAGTGMRRILTNLLAPTEKAAEVMRKYGVETDMTTISTEKFVEVLQKLEGASIGELRAISGMYALSPFVALVESANKAEGGLAAVAAQLQNVQGYAATTSDKLRDNLKLELENLVSVLGVIQVEAFNTFGGGLRAQIAELTQYLQNNGAQVAGVISSVASAAVSVTRALVEWGPTILKLAATFSVFKVMVTALNAVSKAWIAGTTAIGLLRGTMILLNGEVVKATTANVALAASQSAAAATAGTAATATRGLGAAVAFLGGKLAIATAGLSVIVGLLVTHWASSALTSKDSTVLLSDALDVLALQAGTTAEALEKLSDAKFDHVMASLADDLKNGPKVLADTDTEIKKVTESLRELNKERDDRQRLRDIRVHRYDADPGFDRDMLQYQERQAALETELIALRGKRLGQEEDLARRQESYTAGLDRLAAKNSEALQAMQKETKDLVSQANRLGTALALTEVDSEEGKTLLLRQYDDIILKLTEVKTAMDDADPSNAFEAWSKFFSLDRALAGGVSGMLETLKRLRGETQELVIKPKDEPKGPKAGNPILDMLKEAERAAPTLESVSRGLSEVAASYAGVAANSPQAVAAMKELGLSSEQAAESLSQMGRDKALAYIGAELTKLDPRFKDFGKTVATVGTTSLTTAQAQDKLREILTQLEAKAPGTLAFFGGMEAAMAKLGPASDQIASGLASLVQRVNTLVEEGDKMFAEMNSAQNFDEMVAALEGTTFALDETKQASLALKLGGDALKEAMTETLTPMQRLAELTKLLDKAMLGKGVDAKTKAIEKLGRAVKGSEAWYKNQIELLKAETAATLQGVRALELFALAKEQLGDNATADQIKELVEQMGKDGLADAFLDAKNGAEALGEAMQEAFSGPAGAILTLTKRLGDLQKAKARILATGAPLTEEEVAQIHAYNFAIENTTLKLLSEQVGAFIAVADAMAGLASEGSKEQKVLQQTAAVLGVVQAAAVALAGVKGALAVVNQATGDPYTAFARMAAMAAAVAPLLAAIGAAIPAFGGGGGGGTNSAAYRQERQGTGTVLGDSTAKSESILNAVEITANATEQLVGINRGMLNALNAMVAGISGASALLARGAGDIDLPTLNTGSSFLGINFGNIFGGKESLRDQGIRIVGGTLSSMIDDIMVQSYASIHRSGGWFRSSRDYDRFTTLGDDVANQFQMVLSSMADSVRAAAEALGLNMDEINARIASFQIEEIRISTKDLSAEEAQKELEAAFSAIFDGLAGHVVPFIAQFQKVGEGLAETLIRVATGVQVTQEAMIQLGFSLDETDPEKFARASEALMGLAGGVDAFIEGMSSFVSNFATEEHKFAVAQDALTRAFAQAGIEIPATRDAMWDLMQAQDATTESGREIIAMLLRLAGVSDSYYDMLEDRAAAMAGIDADISAGAWEQYLDGLSEGQRAIVELTRYYDDWIASVTAAGATAEQLTAIEEQRATAMERLLEAQAEQVAGMLDDARFEDALAGMSDFEASVARMNKTWEESIARMIELGASEEELAEMRKLQGNALLRLAEAEQERLAAALESYEALVGGLRDELGEAGVSEFAVAMRDIDRWTRATTASLNDAARAAGLQAAREEDLALVHEVAANRAARAIAALQAQAEALAAELYGTPLSRLDARIAELQEAESAASSAIGGFSGALSDAANAAAEAMGLLLGSYSPLRAVDKLPIAMDALRRGETDANTVLGIAQKVYGSGRAYNDIFYEVQRIAAQNAANSSQGGGGNTVVEGQSTVSREMQALIAERDALLAEQQAAQRFMQASDLAQMVADLSGARGEGFDVIAESLGFTLEQFAADLRLSGVEDVEQYLEQLQEDQRGIAELFDTPTAGDLVIEEAIRDLTALMVEEGRMGDWPGDTVPGVAEDGPGATIPTPVTAPIAVPAPVTAPIAVQRTEQDDQLVEDAREMVLLLRELRELMARGVPAGEDAATATERVAEGVERLAVILESDGGAADAANRRRGG